MESAATASKTPPPPEKPARYNKFLAYCIEKDAYGYYRGDSRFKLVPHVGNRRKNGVTLEKSVARPDLSKMQKYLADEDVPICLKLEHWRRKKTHLRMQKHKSALVEALLSDETSKLKIDADTLSHLFSPIG